MKILMSAYACEPGSGSEPGVGWNFARAAAWQHDVCVLTRTNNRERIEAELRVETIPGLRFAYVDLPPWARRWKRGQRRIRLYYVVWQLLAAREARRLCANEHFDVVHHVTFANAWLPGLACLAPAPFVLGPVGGGQVVPARLLPGLGARACLTELLLRLRFLGRFNPVVRLAWHRAVTVLVNNEETKRRLPRSIRGKCVLRQHACVDSAAMPGRCAHNGDRPRAVYAGRLNRFKGVEIAIRAIAETEKWELLVIGGGRDRARLERLVERRGLGSRISFTGPLPQDELWRTMATANALLLPSFKEGASLIAAEALAIGLPIVAFGVNGTPALAAVRGARAELVPPSWPGRAVTLFAEALTKLEGTPLVESSPDFGLAALSRDLDSIYRCAVSWKGLAPNEVGA